MSGMTQVPDLQAKIEDYNCVECGKRFNSYNNYHSHLKAKHSSSAIKTAETIDLKDSADKTSKPKAPNKLVGKNKGFQQYQQDLEDKIYAFLGELGQKHIDNPRQSENISEESDRMMGQANYLENNVVRTPFELEFDVKKELPTVSFQNPELQHIFQTFEKDTLALHEKLMAEKDIWQLRDPIQMDKYEQEQFSLVNVTNVLNNYPKKNLELSYPQMSTFTLWLAKICKPQAWREFYLLIGYTLYQFQKYISSKAVIKEKSQANWKAFTIEHIVQAEQGLPQEISEHMSTLDYQDAAAFLKLYYKWVTFFDLF